MLDCRRDFHSDWHFCFCVCKNEVYKRKRASSRCLSGYAVPFLNGFCVILCFFVVRREFLYVYAVYCSKSCLFFLHPSIYKELFKFLFGKMQFVLPLTRRCVWSTSIYTSSFRILFSRTQEPMVFYSLAHIFPCDFLQTRRPTQVSLS